MNNIFLEGPIQTGKSTLIRKVLTEHFGPTLDGVGGFTCQRMFFPTQGDEKRFGFRLMPASAPITAHTCVVATNEDLISSDGVFKVIGGGSSRTNLKVFDTKGVMLMEDALTRAKAGDVSLVLLDEIGGHEMTCDEFRTVLFEILDSAIPCIGVIKTPESTEKMVSKLPEAEAKAIVSYNNELHKKITGTDGQSGEILYFERGNQTVADALGSFISKIR